MCVDVCVLCCASWVSSHDPVSCGGVDVASERHWSLLLVLVFCISGICCYCSLYGWESYVLLFVLLV